MSKTSSPGAPSGGTGTASGGGPVVADISSSPAASGGKGTNEFDTGSILGNLWSDIKHIPERTIQQSRAARLSVQEDAIRQQMMQTAIQTQLDNDATARWQAAYGDAPVPTNKDGSINRAVINKSMTDWGDTHDLNMTGAKVMTEGEARQAVSDHQIDAEMGMPGTSLHDTALSLLGLKSSAPATDSTFSGGTTSPGAQGGSPSPASTSGMQPSTPYRRGGANNNQAPSISDRLGAAFTQASENILAATPAQTGPAPIQQAPLTAGGFAPEATTTGAAPAAPGSSAAAQLAALKLMLSLVNGNGAAQAAPAAPNYFGSPAGQGIGQATTFSPSGTKF